MQLATLGADVHSLLDQFVEDLTDQGIVIPKLVFVGSGEIAWDGPLLAIHLNNLPSGEPGVPQGAMRVADQYHFNVSLFVMLLREVASVGPNSGRAQTPSAKAMNAEGMASFNDAAALTLAAVNIFGDYSSTTYGETVKIIGTDPVGPYGGLAGVRLRVDLNVH
jgi:hypothetical protein